MPDTSTIVVPDAVRAQFPELTELIVHSESMNDEEREYWFGVLPAMTPEQVQNLQGILQNEKDQLAAIDAKYGTTPSTETPTRSPDEIHAERLQKLRERQVAEQAEESTESSNEDDILKQISEV